jgi:hypothetical protein
MLFQRINRSDPEKIFLVAKNSYNTASLTNGQAVEWDYVHDIDGVGVTLSIGASAAKTAGLVAAGIAAETIAAGAYGLIQVYGYHSAVRVRSLTAGSPAVATGTQLALINAVFCLEGVPSSVASNAIVHTYKPCAFALAANALYTTSAIAAFIKAL